jgi:hypothetical protein
MNGYRFFLGAVPLLFFGLVTASAQRRLIGEAQIPGRPDLQASGCTSEDLAPSQELRGDDLIAIEHTACYGICPTYTVTVHANGKIAWQGKGHVAQQGSGTAVVQPDAARSLIEKFRTSGFWKLCASYNRMVTDVPTAITTLRIGDNQKSVSDRGHGAPEWVHELDYQVDSLADTHRWIHGDPAGEIFQPFLYLDGHGPKPGLTELMRASAVGNSAEIQKQLTALADPNAQDDSGWTSLMYATLATKADATRILLDGGADPNVRSRMGQTALMAASLAVYVIGERLEMLLAAGARTDVRDARNMSALDYLGNRARNWPSRTAEYKRLLALLQ